MDKSQIKIKKRLVEDILQGFENENHTIFRDQDKARDLISYSIQMFILESNKKNVVQSK
jgi:hypothetical protein